MNKLETHQNHSAVFRRSLRVAALTIGLGGFLSSITASAQIAAFPGAEGAGAFAKGGRGGDVYHVTNTNSSGAGSLADGIANAPAAGRTIVFDVSGYSHISGTLRITKNKVTIAGQTAPGDGFGLKDGTFLISSDDVVIRHLRVRDGNSADAINVDSNSINTVFDHVDAMLSNDENFSSFNAPPENLTFQWSMNAWGMETHSAGGLWDQNHATAHHTLWSHNHTRNPKARPNGCLDWINNVTFDWDIGFIMGDSDTPANWQANVRGCYFVCPPGNIRSVALEGARIDRNGDPNFHLYLDNCRMDDNGNGVLDFNSSKTGYSLVSGNSYAKSPTPFANNGIPVAIDDPLTAYKKVLSAAGPLRLQADPTQPLRDDLNSILVNNVLTQRRNHVTSPAGTGADNGGFGFLDSIAPAPDTDQDGMPNYWETAIGTSTTSASNNTQVPSGAYLPASPAGYTLLEDYLHFLAIPHAVVPKNGIVDIDLRKYTVGFTKATVSYALSNAVNGTATLNGSSARFTPTAGFSGRARFDFRVTDGDGSTWLQTFAVLATPGALPSPWATQDVGTVGAVGAANYANNYAIAGSGADIWSTADECRYVYQAASGDCSITARVTSLQNTHSRAKAGVMIRETLNGNSTQAFVGLTPSVGAEFIRRVATGGVSTSSGAAGIAAPYWVRVTRTGSTFTGATSPDGVTWTTLGSTTIAMASNVQIGLAVNSHADGTQCTATFTDVTVSP